MGQREEAENQTGNRGSSIPGVQMLELHKLDNFPVVQQLHAAMKAKYGRRFHKGKAKYVPQMTNLEQLDATLSQEQHIGRKSIDLLDKAKDDYIKIFSETKN